MEQEYDFGLENLDVLELIYIYDQNERNQETLVHNYTILNKQRILLKHRIDLLEHRINDEEKKRTLPKGFFYNERYYGPDIYRDIKGQPPLVRRYIIDLKNKRKNLEQLNIKIKENRDDIDRRGRAREEIIYKIKRLSKNRINKISVIENMIPRARASHAANERRNQQHFGAKSSKARLLRRLKNDLDFLKIKIKV